MELFIRKIMNSRTTTLLEIISAFGVGIVLIAALSGPVFLFTLPGPTIFPSGSWATIVGSVLALIGSLPSLFRRTLPRVHPAGFVLLLCLLPFTDWFCRPHGFMISEASRGELLLCSLAGWLLLRSRPRIVLRALTAVVPVLLIWAFFSEADGRLLFSDDHATVLYRLTGLQLNMPSIPHYNPLWNAGLDQRDYFATGILNLYLLWYPVIHFFPIDRVYNLIISVTLFFGPPLSLYAAARVLRFRKEAAFCCALLASGASFMLLRWGLKYGSMGFVLSCILTPFNVAAALALIGRHPISLRLWIVSIVTMTMMLFWTPTGLALLPLGLIGLLKIRELLRKPGLPSFAIVLATINLSWMIIFISVSNVGSFVALESGPSEALTAPVTASQTDDESEATDTPTQKGPSPAKDQLDSRIVKRLEHGNSLRGAATLLREWASKTNPLILLLCIPALALLPAGSIRLGLSITAGWLLLLGSIGAQVKPQLELERMLILLSMVACIPCGRLVWLVIRSNRLPRPLNLRSLTACLVIGYVLCGVFLTGGFIRKRSYDYYWFADPAVNAMRQAISLYGGDGRVVFPGFMLHQLSGGHLAPLVFWTGKPLVASSPFHNLWKYKELVPSAYMHRENGGVERYLDLMNATSVIVYQKEWKKHFERLSRRPTHVPRYTRVWQGDAFSMFTRDQPAPSYFLEGDGTILEQNSNSVSLLLKTSSAVIKFQYYRFLESSACQLSRVELPGDLNFIKLSECPTGQPITIRAMSPWKRVFG